MLQYLTNLVIYTHRKEPPLLMKAESVKAMFNRLLKAGKKYNETNDCTVRAVGVACRVKYEIAHNAMSYNGRAPKKGASPSMILEAIKSLGFNVKPEYDTGKTIASLKLSKGTYVVFVRGHVVTVIDGTISEDMEGSRKRIDYAYKVTKRRKFTPAISYSGVVNKIKVTVTDTPKWKIVYKGRTIQTFMRKPTRFEYDAKGYLIGASLSNDPSTSGKLRLVRLR